jgi:hypothetical protein
MVSLQNENQRHVKIREGTDFVVTKMQIDEPIPDYVFNKSNLKK